MNKKVRTLIRLFNDKSGGYCLCYDDRRKIIYIDGPSIWPK